jgi:hypothetical protein
MLGIEMSNLEINLGELLGCLLHISPEAGRLVYLTPHSSFGRLAMVENIVKATLVEKSEGHVHLAKLLARAKAIMGKRHNLIHGAWGLPPKDRQGEVRWHSLPFMEDKPSRPVPISELNSLIEDIRDLSENVRQTTADAYQHWPAYTLQPISPLPSTLGKSDQARKPQSKPPKRQAPP